MVILKLNFVNISDSKNQVLNGFQFGTSTTTASRLLTTQTLLNESLSALDLPQTTTLPTPTTTLVNGTRPQSHSPTSPDNSLGSNDEEELSSELGGEDGKKGGKSQRNRTAYSVEQIESLEKG